MGQLDLPLKPYFRIGEVAELLGVETHVLRYWESEFPQLRPVRAPSRQRLYKRPDVLQLMVIRDLLYNQGYTIAGAKRRLAELVSQPPPPPTPPTDISLAAPAPASPRQAKSGLAPEVIAELRAILGLLS
jgi:DNA-binding transcriptional MerR regulator